MPDSKPCIGRGPERLEQASQQFLKHDSQRCKPISMLNCKGMSACRPLIHTPSNMLSFVDICLQSFDTQTLQEVSA